MALGPNLLSITQALSLVTVGLFGQSQEQQLTLSSCQGQLLNPPKGLPHNQKCF